MKTTSYVQTIEVQGLGFVAMVAAIAVLVITGSGEELLSAITDASQALLAMKYR